MNKTFYESTTVVFDPQRVVIGNLEWRTGPDEDITWAEATAWVIKLGEDWRLPSASEALSVYARKACRSCYLKTSGWAIWLNKKDWLLRLDCGNNSIWRKTEKLGKEYSPGCRVFAVRKM